MMLQRLATGATGVKQARYRRRPSRGSEALVRACAVYTQRYCVDCIYRRGFCTLVLSLHNAVVIPIVCVLRCVCIYLSVITLLVYIFIAENCFPNSAHPLTEGDGPAVPACVSLRWLHTGHWVLSLSRIPYLHCPCSRRERERGGGHTDTH